MFSFAATVNIFQFYMARNKEIVRWDVHGSGGGDGGVPHTHYVHVTRPEGVPIELSANCREGVSVMMTHHNICLHCSEVWPGNSI